MNDNTETKQQKENTPPQQATGETDVLTESSLSSVVGGAATPSASLEDPETIGSFSTKPVRIG